MQAGNFRVAVAVAASVLAPASGQTPEQQAEAMLSKMSLEEKVTLLSGHTTNYTGGVPEIVNATSGVRIPPLNLNDGPQGYRSGGTTCWPSALTVGATFDVELAGQWGQAMGKEFYDKGANVQLGPGVCLARVPVNGRNFEYISGEDPFLGYTMVQPVVKGIQSQNVIANAKHYLMNNQETNRGGMTSAVDERTRFEMYMPPFEGASVAGVGSIMCSYNKIQTDGLNEYGDWSCENAGTLMRDYKERVGFKGWVMSDWGATHSTSIMQGLDQEMPGNGSMGDALKTAVLNGDIPESAVDDSVLRILTPMYEMGLFDHYDQWTNNTRRFDDVTSKAHSVTARTIAGAATVLLKNDGVLPIDPSRVKSVGVFGANGGPEVIVHGGGSGSVAPSYVITPYDGIAAAFRPDTQNCSFIQDKDYYVAPSTNLPNISSKEDCCSACFAQYPSCTYFTFTPPSGCWLHPSGGEYTNHTGYISGSCVGGTPTVNVSFSDGSDLAASAALAASVDVAVVFVGTQSSEGYDRTNLSFPDDQNALVAAVAKAAPKRTVVVAITPGAALLPWVDDVSAALTMFMPGLEVGHAIADVLTGSVNPTGRLPLTFPNVENEVNFTRQQYPGINTISVYSERLEVGYRWYGAHNVKPAFPFGHGLSYTTFGYTRVSASLSEVSVTVTNNGTVPGAEVAQLYLGFPTAAGEPPKQLKGFVKTAVLAPGGSVVVRFPLTNRDLSVWDAGVHAWVKQTGLFQAYVGASSEDIRATASFSVTGV